MADELTIDVQPLGPDPAILDRIAATILERGALSEYWGATSTVCRRSSSSNRAASSRNRPEPQRFRATVYDYTRQATLLAEGSLRDPEKLTMSESGVMPIPSPEEFAAAVDVVVRDKELGPPLGDNLSGVYPPMPPLIVDDEAAAGLVDDEAGSGLRRVVAVGLLPARGKGSHEIVGVDLADRSVIRFDTRSPATARAGDGICGVRARGSRRRRKGLPDRSGSR